MERNAPLLGLLVAVALALGCSASPVVELDAARTDSGGDAGLGDAGRGDAGSDAAVADTGAAACTGDEACGGATAHCDVASGVCAGCATDADCGGLVCDVASGVCFDCVAETDCRGSLPICYAGSHQCSAACTVDADCPRGDVPGRCNAEGRCVDCTEGGHCGSGFCELVTFSCVGCLVDGDCPSSAPHCGPSLECTPTCATAADCGGLACDPSSGFCVECATNADCPGQICQRNHTCG